MLQKGVIRFEESSIVDRVEGKMSNVLSGDPSTVVEKVFVHPAGKLVSGYWECQAGKFTLCEPREEFCIILDGEAIITEEDGTSHTVKKGDAFMLPQGATTTWEIKDFVRKIFVVAFGMGEEK